MTKKTETKLILEAEQFRMSLTDYNFILVEQDIPMRHAKASIAINPDQVADIVEAFKNISASGTDGITMSLSQKSRERINPEETDSKHNETIPIFVTAFPSDNQPSVLSL